MRLAIALLVACLPFALPFAAASQTAPLVQTGPLAPLSETQMRDTLFGIVLDGEYQDGQAWRERLGSDGTSLYEQDGVSAKGTVTFERNRICFSYPGQFSGGCFETWQRSGNCFDFYSARPDGTMEASATQRRNGIGWTARAWRADRPSTCVSDQIA